MVLRIRKLMYGKRGRGRPRKNPERYEENRPRSLRPHKKVNYKEEDEVSVAGNDDEFFTPKRKRQAPTTSPKKHSSSKSVTEDHIYLIDFGLASRFINTNGEHHPFCMDQRRAHDGTLEFTSRDAHMGAHSRRSDLECLGYNMMYWILGNLPWKDEKLQNQPEQVHRMKEIFMTDASEMLKLIYGQQVPKFLGDYFHYVDNLAYDERPDYNKLRKMFQQEFTQLGFKLTEMKMNIADLKRSCVDVKKAAAKDADDNKSDKIKNVRSIAKLGLLLPIKDRLNDSRRSSVGCRISPKNLRSKSEKVPNKKKSRFSWAEVLSQDPDQIARQRAEKEFEREQATETPIRYKGRPTYAIIEIENRLNANSNDSRNVFEDEDYIQGYTKPMMDIIRRRQASLAAALEKEQEDEVEEEEEPKPMQAKSRRGRRKSDNPTKITVNKTGGRTQNGKVATAIHDNFYIRPKRKNEVYTHQLTPPATTDESSCSSSSSLEPGEIREVRPVKMPTLNRQNAVSYRSQQQQHHQQKSRNNYPKKNGSTGTSRSSSHTSINSISSEDSVGTSWTTSGISSSAFLCEQEDSEPGELEPGEVVSSDESDDQEDFQRTVKPVQLPKRRGRPPGSKNKNTLTRAPAVSSRKIASLRG